MSDANPVSIRLNEEEKEKLKALGDGTIASGVRTLIDLHYNYALKYKIHDDAVQEIEDEIKRLKKSPLGVSKEEILELEELLNKAKAKLDVKGRAHSLKQRLFKIVNS